MSQRIADQEFQKRVSGNRLTGNRKACRPISDAINMENLKLLIKYHAVHPKATFKAACTANNISHRTFLDRFKKNSKEIKAIFPDITKAVHLYKYLKTYDILKLQRETHFLG